MQSSENAPDDLVEAVEAVARLAERSSGRRSPFHLCACGGCGAPSFVQPCSLCGFYPMGAVKGTYSPRIATFEQFDAMIDRSGPDRCDGTIATWHARSTFDWVRGKPTAKFHEEAEEASVLEASALDMPTTRRVWDVVSDHGVPVHRPQAPTHVNAGWTGIFEFSVAISQESERLGPVSLADLRSVVANWVEAVHGEDPDTIRNALEAGVRQAGILRSSGIRVGNMVYASEAMNNALANIPSVGMRP